ncbi:hypothetical protein [Paenibacillus polysaccharolyticus]
MTVIMRSPALSASGERQYNRQHLRIRGSILGTKRQGNGEIVGAKY